MPWPRLGGGPSAPLAPRWLHSMLSRAPSHHHQPILLPLLILVQGTYSRGGQKSWRTNIPRSSSQPMTKGVSAWVPPPPLLPMGVGRGGTRGPYQLFQVPTPSEASVPCSGNSCDSTSVIGAVLSPGLTAPLLHRHFLGHLPNNLLAFKSISWSAPGETQLETIK